MLVVVIGLIGLEYYFPGIIKGYGSKTVKYWDITINLIICIFFMAVFMISFSNTYNSEKEKAERYARGY